MTHSKQAQKRVRQTERDRLANKAKMSRMRTEMKKLLTAVESGDKGTAQAALPGVHKLIDKAAKSHIIHANTAARKKSLVTRAVAGMSA